MSIAATHSLDMTHDEDPKELLIRELGAKAALVHPIGAQILIGVYVRPEKTKGGIILTEKNRQEDLWQGKIGLIMDMGPLAFTDDDNHTWGDRRPKVGDWVTYRVGDTLGALSGQRMLRFLDENAVRAIVDHPDALY